MVLRPPSQIGKSMTSSLSRALQRLINHLISLLRSLVSFLSRWWTRASQKPLLLDSGRRVFVGKQLAEGGFSVVLEAWDAESSSGVNGHPHQSSSSQQHQRYVLKRVHGDAEGLDMCRREAQVHRAVQYHPNVMPLLGMCWTKNECFLLFPRCPGSLRGEIQQRVASAAAATSVSSALSPPSIPPAPWKEVEVLQLFHGILQGVSAMHQHNFTHRDIKIDNVLLSSSSNSNGGRTLVPVLMDFGSAGPTSELLTTRRHILEALERASIHTTVSYRPPELFEGGLRVGDTLDYTKVDVWSLACTLFATAYGHGASPCECEFLPLQSSSSSDRRHWGGPSSSSSSLTGRGVVRVVDCTHLKVLAGLPSNPPPWYSQDVWALLVEMMQQDPHRRPSLTTVIERVQALIVQAGGEFQVEHNRSRNAGHDEGDDEDDDDVELALLSTNRLL